MTLIHGDCLEVMAGMEPESVDAVVTDPPYGLEFMGKEWDRLSTDPDIGKSRRTGFEAVDGPRDKRAGNEGGTWFGSRDAKVPNYTRATNAKCRNCGKWRISGGHGGTGNIYGCHCEKPDFPNVAADAARRMGDWHAAWAEAAYRVAKPSAYLLAFGGTRTVHRMTCAIEDAGWIVRDMLVWGYASGFPKSKASLKPAWEPIVMARKPGPLRMLAVDACRIPAEPIAPFGTPTKSSGGILNETADAREPFEQSPLGRWPANVILTDPIFDGGIEGVVGGGETTGVSAPASGPTLTGTSSSVARGQFSGVDATPFYGDSGTYSRFFLIPKADRADREPVYSSNRPGRAAQSPESEGAATTPGLSARQNVHPTVKPTDLMRHLVRLVTPTGGIVLDPFLGSGTTALAAEMEGFGWVGIEREAEYVAIAEARLNGVQRGLGLEAS